VATSWTTVDVAVTEVPGGQVDNRNAVVTAPGFSAGLSAERNVCSHHIAVGLQ